MSTSAFIFFVVWTLHISQVTQLSLPPPPPPARKKKYEKLKKQNRLPETQLNERFKIKFMFCFVVVVAVVSLFRRQT